MRKVQLTVDQEQKLKTVPRRYRELYRKAATGSSRRAAIRVHCLECVGWVMHEVDLCTGRGCPLFPYRTFHTADDRRSENTTALAQGHDSRAVVARERPLVGQEVAGCHTGQLGRSMAATPEEKS